MARGVHSRQGGCSRRSLLHRADLLVRPLRRTLPKEVAVKGGAFSLPLMSAGQKKSRRSGFPLRHWDRAAQAPRPGYPGPLTKPPRRPLSRAGMAPTPRLRERGVLRSCAEGALALFRTGFCWGWASFGAVWQWR
jgi:hypothetical protein